MENFQVNLRGIIDLLSRHLYSSPSVFVRELLQNAVDAVTARRAIEPGCDSRIQVQLVGGGDQPPTLIVRDAGIGLNAEEMHTFLATIGSSSKRGEAGLGQQRESFIGQFGIGILSCFMVSDEIVVISRSARTPTAAALEWRGNADGSYAIRELTHQGPAGTQVFVRARADEDAQAFFKRDALLEVLHKQAGMLRFPIEFELDGRREAITQAVTPWEMAERGDMDALREYARDEFGFEPLEIIPVRAKAGRVSGVALIVPHRMDAHAHGDHRAYLRGMFVTSTPDDLIPPWAFFARFVLNSEQLPPTASRESFQTGEVLEDAQQQLGDCVIRHLLRIAREEPVRLTGLLLTHDVAIRSMALHDDAFFDAIADLLEFETTRGRLRLGDFRRDNEMIRVAPTSDQYRRITPVAIAHGYCIFNGGLIYDEDLLRRASERLPNLGFQHVDAADLVGEFQEISNDEREVIATFCERAVEELDPFAVDALIRSFMPDSLPAFFANSTDAEFRRSLDRTKAISTGHWRKILDSMQPSDAPPPRSVLCLNWNSILIRGLAACTDESLQRTLIRVLYVQALMLGQHPLTHREIRVLSTGLLEIMQFRLPGALPK